MQRIGMEGSGLEWRGVDWQGMVFFYFYTRRFEMNLFETILGTAALGGMYYWGNKDGEKRLKKQQEQEELLDEIAKLKQTIEEMKYKKGE